jgi:hypothetical protein
MRAHTPGPWYVDGKLIRGLASGRIAQVGGDFYDDGRRDADGWTFTPPLDTDSNARLISAAPELLAALIELRNAVTSDGTDTQHNACRMADAAIQKAGGA